MNTDCFKCDKAQWDADGCTCKITGLLVGNVVRGCGYRKDTLEEQLKDWKEEYANLNKISYGFYKELKEAKQLLKAAVEDFAKLDRENAKNKNCMMPEMDCANCPLSWDSVDDRVEPCHNWRYANEALKLLNDEKINNVE